MDLRAESSTINQQNADIQRLTEADSQAIHAHQTDRRNEVFKVRELVFFSTKPSQSRNFIHK